MPSFPGFRFVHGIGQAMNVTIHRCWFYEDLLAMFVWYADHGVASRLPR
jgi:hypothetical protein